MKDVEVITTRWFSNDPANEFPVCDPTTGEVAHIIKGAGLDDVNRAIDFAYDTYQNVWRHVSGPERDVCSFSVPM